MNPETRLFIDGELCEARSGKTYANVNPATEAVMGEVADAGPVYRLHIGNPAELRVEPGYRYV